MKFSDLRFLVVLTSICTVFLYGAEKGIPKAKPLGASPSEAVWKIAPGLFVGVDPDLEKRFQQSFEFFNSKRKYWQAYFSRRDAGACFIKAKGPGMWGDLEIVAGFQRSPPSIIGVRVVSQTETPGLGDRILDPAFLGQFAGLGLGENGVALGKRQPGNGQIDGITGATISAKALVNVVNEAWRESQTFSAEK